MSGTSMASPHMAGAAALIAQYVKDAFPGLSGEARQNLINNLILSTAMPLKDETGVPYTVRKQGAGLANIYQAIKTQAYLTVEGADLAKAELGHNTDGTFSFRFTIHNFGTEALSYQLGVTPLVAGVEIHGGESYLSNYSRYLDASEFAVSLSQDRVTVPAGQSLDVTVGLQLTAKGKENLAVFSNGIYLDGFVSLTADQGADLSLAYLGFYGDWGQAPIFDATLYEVNGEEEARASMVEGSILELDYMTGSGFYLGMNLFGDDLLVDADKIAFASHKMNYEPVSIFSMLGLLRAPKTLLYSVTDQAGEVVYQESASNVIKSFYYANGDYINYELGPDYRYGWEPVYEKDGNYYFLPDGSYKLDVTGLVDGTDSLQELAFPIEIDNEAPEVVKVSYAVEDGTPYLTVTVRDNHYLMGMQLIDDKGEMALSDIIIIDEDEAGAETTAKFDLTEAQMFGFTDGKIVLYDYARNFHESGVFSLVSDGSVPSQVKINQQSITCRTDTNPFQLDVFVYPDTAIDKSVSWSSSDPSVVSVDQAGWVTPHEAGEVTITATAVNGVFGTTSITVSEFLAEWPEDNIIDKDGTYRVPDSLNSKVTIRGDARWVTLIGNADADHSGLYFANEVEGLDLTIRDLRIRQTSNTLINFNGGSNSLSIQGENTLTSGMYQSKALVQVAAQASLTVQGGGTLNLNLTEAFYAAGIGSNPGADAGTIVIDSGTIKIDNRGQGAGIGSGSGGGAPSITINGGDLDVRVPIDGEGYFSNQLSCGAGIGTGYSSAGKDVDITINGGRITGFSEVASPVIGQGYVAYGSGTPSKFKITINGGDIDLLNEYKEADGTPNNGGGACIGTGFSQSGSQPQITIAITGGSVKAENKGGGAAIGGGAGLGARVFISGGTVTAFATPAVTNYGGSAIGSGSYNSNSSVYIDGGSVLVKNTGNGPAITGEAKNENLDTLYETAVRVPQVQSILVDGLDWSIDRNHADSDSLHLWLPASQTVRSILGTSQENGKLYRFRAQTLASKVTVKQFVGLTPELDGITLTLDQDPLRTDGELIAFIEDGLSGTLTAGTGKLLPAGISITSGGAALAPSQISYDSANGRFSVTGFEDELVLAAKATEMPVDRSGLLALVEQAEALDAGDYTGSSWAALAEALTAAKAVLADEAASAEDINQAARQLAAALAALETPGSRDDLLALIAQAKALPETDYVSSAYALLEAAIAAAEEVAGNESASQAEIDSAAAALQKAMDSLVKRGDKSQLRALAESRPAADARAYPANYTGDSWAAFNVADVAARLVLDNPDALQSEIDKAYGNLSKAINQLVMSKPYRDDLAELIRRAESLDEAAYTPASWQALQAEILKAKSVLADESALQSDINQAEAALRAAIEGLVLLADKTGLNGIIAEAEEALANSGDYTEDSLALLEEALEAARRIAEDPSATQAETDKAEADLRAALEGLAKKADTGALEEAVQTLDGLLETDYTIKSWTPFDDALKRAKSLLEEAGKASQEAVDEALRVLLAAHEALVEAGDPAKLQTALLEAQKLDLEEYTEDSAQAIRGARTAAAQAIEGRASAEELEEAYQKLVKAIESAVKKDEGSEDPDDPRVPLTFTGLPAAWTEGDLVFIINAEAADLIQVLVDGNRLDAAAYSVESGSTVLTIKEAYLSSLTAGVHTLTAEFAAGTQVLGGQVSAEFEIQDGNDPVKPPVTGETLLLPLLGIGFLAAAVLLALEANRRRKVHESQD